MKILFESFTYYPLTSGVAVVVQTIAEGLSHIGHEVSVVTRKRDIKESEEVINGVHIYRIDYGQDIFKRNIGECERYINFVKNFPKDILVLECVQCHSTDILLPHLKDMNCKVVLHSHGGPGLHDKIFEWKGDIAHTIGHTHNWYRWKKYYKYILPASAKYIDVAICLSMCASDLAFMNKHMKRVELMENAANPMFLDEALYKMDISSVLGIKNKEFILCIANYIPNKSQDEIIKAFTKVKNKNVSLVLIGSRKNKFYHQISQQATKVLRKTGKEIKVLSGVDRQFFPAIINQAKLFVMASKHEEYPVSLVEAMACGTPFVSTDAGCSRIIPGGVTVTNRSDLGLFMDFLESHSSLLCKFGKQGKDYATTNNTIHSMINQFNNILKSL